MKKAVILFNLGGPDKLESVEPFLFNLFNDPAIISIPSIFRYPLAKFISKRRTSIAKNIPVICFPKGIKENYPDFCSLVKPDCISIDYDIDPKWLKGKLNGLPIQGGLDPKILLTDKTNIKKNTENYLNIFKDYPYIFNLGHGVLPETKPETIEYLIKIVRDKK